MGFFGQHPDDHGSHRYVPEGPRPPRRVPFDGPRGATALKLIDQVRKDPLPMLGPMQERWGDRVGLSAFNYKFVFLYHPDDIEAVLVGGTHSIMKAYALRQSRFVMGGQLLVAEGVMHTKQRKALAPAFSARRVGIHTEAIAQVADRFIAAWGVDAPVEAEHAMGEIDLAVSARTMFGGTLEGEEARAFAEAIHTCIYAFPIAMHPLRGIMDALQMPPKGKVKRARRQLNRTVKRLIEDGRARLDRGEDAGDILPILVEHYATEGGMLHDDDLLVDEARGLLLGGHETLARSLAWGLHLLAERPDIQERIRDEVNAVCGDGPILEAHVEHFHETRRAFMEAIRLYPAGALHVRETQEEIRLDDETVLAPGLQVAIPCWTVQRDPRWWKDPDTFDPDRFKEPDPDRPRWAYNPWGGGTRVCIGASYATLFGIVVMATAARRVRLEVAPESRPEPVSIFTVRAKHGLPLVTRAWEPVPA